MDNQIEITPEMKKFVANMSMNSVLHSIDESIQQHVAEPETQMGILILLLAKAFGRVRRKHKITGAKRKIVLDKAIEDFRRKVKEYGWEDKPEVPVAANENPPETRLVSPGQN